MLADFVEVIRRTVDGLSENTPEIRGRVYEKARSAVRRQLENMAPRPSDDMINRQLGRLERAIHQVESESEDQTNFAQSDIAQGWFDEPESAAPPAPPRQEIGPTYAVSESGHLSLLGVHNATELDLLEIGGLRRVLSEAVDDLIALTSASNAFAQIAVVARKYRDALGHGETDLALDLLYSYGVRLENSAHRIQGQIASGDYPEMSQAVAEALDSVVAIHGPTILSTQVGRELVQKAQQYKGPAADQVAYKETAKQFVAAVSEADILDAEDEEDLRETNDFIDDGPNPSRSTELAHAKNSNLVKAAVTHLLMCAGYVTTTAIGASKFATVPTEALTHLFDGLYSFIVENPKLLIDLAALSGAELSWLPSFVRWAEINRLEMAASKALARFET